MRSLVVYESMFGDNQRVGEAVAAGLRQQGVQVQPIEVGQAAAEVPDGVDLLVVGAPNHAWSLPRASTRRDAAQQAAGELVSPGTGVREWLEALQLPDGLATAAFDTRMSHPRLVVKMDHASTQIERRLAALGGRAVVRAEHFLVADTQGPLEPGEVERAQAWGEQLAAALARA
jgi:hypothetical protein